MNRTLRWSLFSVLFWTAMAVLFSLPDLGQNVHKREVLLWALAQFWSWGLLVPGILAIDKALPFTAQQILPRVVSHLCIGPVITVIHEYVAAILKALLGVEPWSRLFGTALPSVALREMFWSMLMYCLIVGVWEAYLYHTRFVSAELQMERLERNFSEARLNALRMQLDPHFLFNALNTVSAQVEREPKLARRMIEHLGDLLRLSLNSHSLREISLAEELAFLDHYLAIQRIRFGDALRIDLRIAPEVQDALVPSLFIQPLVENAIRHGISKRARGGSITVNALRVEQNILIQVRDDGVGLPSGWTFEKQRGVGLLVTKERFAGMYPGDLSKLVVQRRSEGGTEVSLTFPFHRREETK